MHMSLKDTICSNDGGVLCLRSGGKLYKVQGKCILKQLLKVTTLTILKSKCYAFEYNEENIELGFICLVRVRCFGPCCASVS